MDAGVEIDRHGRMAAVGRGLARAGKRLAAISWRPAIVQNFETGSCAASPRLIGHQQLDDHAARGLGAVGVVLTFMPGVGVRMQLAASTRSPSISTMQTRQLPSGR